MMTLIIVTKNQILHNPPHKFHPPALLQPPQNPPHRPLTISPPAPSVQIPCLAIRSSSSQFLSNRILILQGLYPCFSIIIPPLYILTSFLYIIRPVPTFFASGENHPTLAIAALSTEPFPPLGNCPRGETVVGRVGVIGTDDAGGVDGGSVRVWFWD